MVIGNWLSVFGTPFEGAAFSPLLGGLRGAFCAFAFAIVWENNAVSRRFWGKGKSSEKVNFGKGILKQKVYFFDKNCFGISRRILSCQARCFEGSVKRSGTGDIPCFQKHGMSGVRSKNVQIVWRQTFDSVHLQFKMPAMRIFFLFVFFCFYLFSFSQKPVEKEQVIPLDSIQELAWQKPKSDTVFEVFHLQKQPAFPGGEKELLKFLAESLRWPKGCGDMNITGAIVVRFVIDTVGNCSDVKILKTPGKCFEPMVADIFAKMPCWGPGERAGRRVRTRFALPIRIHWD